MLRILILSLIVLLFALGYATSPGFQSPSHEIVGSQYAENRSDPPEPPRLPSDFTWVGRYIVPDLGIEVPFTWNGSGGNIQMTAGGENHPIYFTNLVYDGELFTLTYKWPGIPTRPCSHVGAFTVDQLNDGFANARFVGRETLHGNVDRVVHHFRSAGVIDHPTGLLPGMDNDVPLRFPLMAGDIYTDVDNPEQIWQLLHFGLQNLYDPNVDEWIVIDQANDAPGEVRLPGECVIG